MPTGIDYTDDEWRESVGHDPLSHLVSADRLLLHRHWMWANTEQREAFDGLLLQHSPEVFEPGPFDDGNTRNGPHVRLYGLPWSVLEASIAPRGRDLDIRGPFRHDIERIADLLRRCRNAVMHAPRPGELLDARIQDLVANQKQQHSFADPPRLRQDVP